MEEAPLGSLDLEGRQPGRIRQGVQEEGTREGVSDEWNSKNPAVHIGEGAGFRFGELGPAVEICSRNEGGFGVLRSWGSGRDKKGEGMDLTYGGFGGGGSLRAENARPRNLKGLAWLWEHVGAAAPPPAPQ